MTRRQCLTVHDSGTDAPARPSRILLLEDHDGSRVVMRLVLRALGHECIAVGDTLTALGLAEAFEPDLIVYDWNTVSRERVGLSIHFRDRLGLRAARIVVLSMLHEPVGFRSRERIDAYLLKPLVPRDLFAASIRVASQ